MSVAVTVRTSPRWAAARTRGVRSTAASMAWSTCCKAAAATSEPVFCVLRKWSATMSLTARSKHLHSGGTQRRATTQVTSAVATAAAAAAQAQAEADAAAVESKEEGAEEAVGAVGGGDGDGEQANANPVTENNVDGEAAGAETTATVVEESQLVQNLRKVCLANQTVAGGAVSVSLVQVTPKAADDICDWVQQSNVRACLLACLRCSLVVALV